MTALAARRAQPRDFAPIHAALAALEPRTDTVLHSDLIANFYQQAFDYEISGSGDEYHCEGAARSLWILRGRPGRAIGQQRLEREEFKTRLAKM